MCGCGAGAVESGEIAHYNNVITEDSPMKSAIRRVGNSHAVIIPKPLLSELGAKAGEAVEINMKNGELVIARVGHDPRAGWAAECKAIVAAGEDGLAWPEFGNKDDEKLVWE